MEPGPGTSIRREARRAAVAVALAVALSSLTVATVLAAPDHILVSPTVPSGGARHNVPFTVTATVVSTSTGTADLAYRGTVEVRTTDPISETPPQHTFTALDEGTWRFSVTLKTLGTQTISVTDMESPGIFGVSPGVEVVPVELTVAVARLAFVAQPTRGVAGAPLVDQPVVAAQDIVGATVTAAPASLITLGLIVPPGGSGTLTCTGGLSALTVAGVATFSGCSMDHAGSGFALTALAPDQPSWGATVSTPFTVEPAAPTTTHLEFSGVPATVAVSMGTGFVVWATTAGGLTDATYRGTVQFRSTDLSATLPAPYTFTAADAGLHRLDVTFATAGTQTVTVTDAAHASIAGTTPGIVVTGGASPTPSPTPSSAPGGALALSTSTNGVTYGGSATLSCALAGAGAGRRIAFQERPLDVTAWAEIGAANSGADGSATLVIRPTVTAAYRAVWTGSSSLAPATSAPAYVAVRYRVALSPITSPRIATRGARLTWTATEGPAAVGVTVRFRVYQMTSAGWRLRATTQVRTTSAGRASFSRTFASAGRWYLEATAIGGSRNATASAPKKYVTVR